jgi:hypothetical protein
MSENICASDQFQNCPSDTWRRITVKLLRITFHVEDIEPRISQAEPREVNTLFVVTISPRALLIFQFLFDYFFPSLNHLFTLLAILNSVFMLLKSVFSPYLT